MIDESTKDIIINNLYSMYGEELVKALSNGNFKVYNNGDFYWNYNENLSIKGTTYENGVIVRQTYCYLMDNNNPYKGLIQRDSIFIVNVNGVNFIAENEVPYNIDPVDGTESNLLERNNSAKAIDDIYNVSMTVADHIASEGFSELVYGEPRIKRIELLDSSNNFARVLK